MPMIRLLSSDHKLFEVEVSIIKKCGTIKTMLENFDFGEDCECPPVPVPNIHSSILQRVIEWATHHQHDEEIDELDQNKENKENKELRSDDIKSWDIEFFKVDQSVMFDLILAANYLDIKSLLDAACKTVANLIKGKEVEEIRRVFNIENDFTPTEEERARKANAWCED